MPIWDGTVAMVSDNTQMERKAKPGLRDVKRQRLNSPENKEGMTVEFIVPTKQTPLVAPPRQSEAEHVLGDHF